MRIISFDEFWLIKRELFSVTRYFVGERSIQVQPLGLLGNGNRRGQEEILGREPPEKPDVGCFEIPDAILLVVNDLLPAGLTFVSATPTLGTYDSTTGVWSIPDLLPVDLPGLGRGEPAPQAILEIVATVDEAGTFENVAASPREAPDVFDPILANNVSSAVVTGIVREAELHVTKTVDPASVIAGGAATFTMTVSNAGPADAEDVVLKDPFPAGTTPVSTPTPGCSITAATLTCDIGLLAVGETASVQVVATIDTPGTFENTVTASTSTDITATSTLTATATVVAIVDPDTGGGGGGGNAGGGGLPVTGGTGAGAAPLVAVVLTLTGVLLIVWSRRKRRDGLAD